MTGMLEVLRDVLHDFNNRTEPYSERDVAKALQSARQGTDVSDLPVEFVAEAMAFDFWPAYHNEETGWGTYYGPMAVLSTDDGRVVESPSLRLVTPEMIHYWTERAQTAVHPNLRARYADLVWDFQKKVTGESPHCSVAHIVIDSIIEIAQRRCYTPEVYVIDKLRRAMALALGLNDSTRSNAVTDATMTYEDAVVVDDKPGLWGFAYDLLFDNDKIHLSEDQRQKLVNDLEDHLTRAMHPSDGKNIDPWLVEASVRRLALHYRKQGKGSDKRRVLTSLSNAFKQASSTASALQTAAWLQHLHSVLIEFELKDLAETAALSVREAEKRTASELKTVSHTIEIPRKEIEQYISQMTSGELSVVFNRIAVHYIPQKSEVQKQLRELATEAPMVYLVPVRIQDTSGRQVANVGPLKDDLEGRTVQQMSQNMNFESVFLRQVFEALAEEHPDLSERLVAYVFLSPVFAPDRRPIIEAGMKAYLAGDHILAVHLLVPQIEQALRVLLEMAGGSVLKPASRGMLTYKLLREMFQDPLLIQVLGEDIVLYLCVLLTDQRGWNIRNRISHGLCDVHEFAPAMSDRVVHVLLCLALIRARSRQSLHR